MILNPYRKQTFFNKTLILYLAIALFFVGAFPADIFAMFLSSSSSSINPPNSVLSTRDQDLTTIQKTLESKILKQRLLDLGLTPAQISNRISQLSDNQLHQVSSRIDSLQTGGGDDALGVIIALLVIGILVVVLLQLSGHKVIITR